MRPAFLYMSSLFVAILYIYLLAVQYVRGDHTQSNVDFNYHNYDQLTSLLYKYNTTYPHLTQLYTIGKSAQGEKLPELHYATHDFAKVYLMRISLELMIFYFRCKPS